MLTTTLTKIRKCRPPWKRWRHCLNALGKTRADDEPLTLERIIEINGFPDALWALRAVDGHQNAIRLYACFFARRLFDIYGKHYPDDRRPREAIEAAERIERGRADAAAVATASTAANDAVNAAISAATWPTVRSAARFAAWSAVWSAARSAAWSAAWSAEMAAVIDIFKAEFIRLCRLEGDYGEVA